MRRTLPALTVICATLALLAAGCGGQKSFSLAETRACLAGQPHVSLARKVDFVASTALGGAMIVDLGRNDVTIAFGLSRDEADRIANAYRRFRGRNIGIEDVLRPQRNAVLLWRAHPSPENESTVTSCLK